jgi:hypothetical protein
VEVKDKRVNFLNKGIVGVLHDGSSKEAKTANNMHLTVHHGTKKIG